MKKEVKNDTEIIDETIQEILDKHKKILKEIAKMDEYLAAIDKIAKGEIE